MIVGLAGDGESEPEVRVGAAQVAHQFVQVVDGLVLPAEGRDYGLDGVFQGSVGLLPNHFVHIAALGVNGKVEHKEMLFGVAQPFPGYGPLVAVVLCVVIVLAGVFFRVAGHYDTVLKGAGYYVVDGAAHLVKLFGSVPKGMHLYRVSVDGTGQFTGLFINPVSLEQVRFVVPYHQDVDVGEVVLVVAAGP